MNMPRPEFVRGIAPGSKLFSLPEAVEPWSNRIVLFEADRRFQPDRDFVFLAAKWAKKQGFPEAGHVYPVLFPEVDTFEMAAWTFHPLYPNQEQRVFFTSGQALLAWKRSTWEKEGHLPNKRFAVHANCYEPDGTWFKTYRLLTF